MPSFGWFACVRWSLLTPALLAAGCATRGEESAGDPGLSHSHGLGVNPADGELYVASHHGVFRIEGGKARRQGSLLQDTMGFTIIGPDRFLASGHPDPRNDTLLEPGMRPLLGLIESMDRGVTWRSLSLRGEVDFHALCFAHDRVYGFDATSKRLMVSADMKQWDARSHVALFSFAVSPADPERIVGSVSDGGVVQSSDGGRSWRAVAGAGPLAFVSWHMTRGLWAVAPSGSVFRSSDEGVSWTRTGTLTGSPTALLADAKGLFVATPNAVYTSIDEGASWTALYQGREQ